MPEIAPLKSLEPYRQCEIRRPSPPRDLLIDGRVIHFLGGYYFDVVWIRNDSARAGRKVTAADGQVWTIAEIYGVKPMARSRFALSPVRDARGES
jgi:hypothetical protein